MKKLVSVLLSVTMAGALLTGCGGGAPKETAAETKAETAAEAGSEAAGSSR